MIAANAFSHHQVGWRRPALAAAALLGAFALVTPTWAQQEAPKSDGGAVVPKTIPVSETYRVAVGDRLFVQVQDKPELSHQADVLPEGVLYYPLVGRIEVKGLRMEELTALLRAKLSTQVRDPDVTIRLVSRMTREASLLGPGVRQQGKRVIKEDNWRVLDLIADAGGLGQNVLPEFTIARLIRRGGEEVLSIDLGKIMSETVDTKENILLQAGDVLMIDVKDASQTHVQIVGAVNRQDSFPIPRDRSILTLVATAGGATPKALLSKSAIKRQSGQVVPVDLSPLRQEGGALRIDTKLEPGDTLVIPENKVTFSVWGANQPGQFEWPENEKVTVLYAIAKANGVNSLTADLKKSYLIRRMPDGKAQTTLLRLDELLKANKSGKTGEAAGDIELKPYDAIYIESKNPYKQGGGIQGFLNTIVPLMWIL